MIDTVRALPFNDAVSVAVWYDAIVPALAVKLAVLDPAATATDPGTVSAAVLLDSVTVPPLVFVSVTVQLLVPPLPSVDGVQDTELTVTAVAKAIDAACVLPFNVAVSVAVWSDAIVPALAVKLAVLDPAATATDPGTVSAAVLLDSVTVPPLVFVRVPVQLLVPPLPSVDGVQDTELSVTAVAKAIDDACVLPFNVAVSVAVWSDAIVPALAVKLAVLDPAATATDPGAVSAAVLLDSVTVPPLIFVSVTVQVLVPPLPSVAGVHDTELTVTGVAKEMDAVRALPFNVAVSVAVWSDAIVPAVAVKVAVVDLATTATDPGTVSAAVLLDSVTVPPPVFESVTVQLLVPPLPSVAGVQNTELTFTAVARMMDAACALPFNVAVSVAVWSGAVASAVAVNVAVVDPAATAADPGTVSAAARSEERRAG